MIINILTTTDTMIKINGADYFYKEEDTYEVIRINGLKHEVVGTFETDKIIGMFIEEEEEE